MRRQIQRFFKAQDGVTAVEYAVLLALIVVACIAAVKAVGDKTSGIWASNKSELDSAGF